MHLPDEVSIRVILLDIEGTTTPIDFVTQVLFPYASLALEGFLRDNFRDPQIAGLIRDLRAQREEDSLHKLRPPEWRDDSAERELRSAVAYCRWLIKRDSKCTTLKALQGMIWQAGYASGELRGRVYPDVPRAFERWQRQKREIAIYSSGSVLAQRLLFQTTPFGDLTRFVRNYFDTNIGAKQDPASYKKIPDSLGRWPAEVLFISDAVKEVEAAKAVKMRSVLCDRSAQRAAAAGSGAIQSFDELFPD